MSIFTELEPDKKKLLRDMLRADLEWYYDDAVDETYLENAQQMAAAISEEVFDRVNSPRLVGYLWSEIKNTADWTSDWHDPTSPDGNAYTDNVDEIAFGCEKVFEKYFKSVEQI